MAEKTNDSLDTIKIFRVERVYDPETGELMYYTVTFDKDPVLETKRN